MGQLSLLLHGLARSLSVGREKKTKGREAGDELMQDVMKRVKKDVILRSSGTIQGKGSSTFASVCSRRGEKGQNQDCSIVWEGFGCQEDMIFCGIFDGHGPWGHYVAKMVRESLPASLLCNWQQALALASLLDEKKLCEFDLWKKSYQIACAAVDEELEHQRRLDAFHSGTTALSIVKHGDLMIIANVGDSRAVLGTTSDDGSLVAVQLTTDFKPNLPQEKERITRSNGRVFCLSDEPEVHRVWLPDRKVPGLAMSRALGDYCVKHHGVISSPEVAQWKITSKDQFVILATDGIWDVISNEEAVQIVSSAGERGKSAKRLVDCAVRAWRRKRKGYAVDDCSALCLFFDPSQQQQQLTLL